jgi:hypothetical protein
MKAILESKRVNLGVLVTAALLALLNKHGIVLSDNVTAALALGLGGLWTAIIYSDAAKPMIAKGILTVQSFRASDIGKIAAGIVAWALTVWQGYQVLQSEPEKVAPVVPAVVVQSAESVQPSPDPLPPATIASDPDVPKPEPMSEAEKKLQELEDEK